MCLIEQYVLYLARWQLSTPILALVVRLFDKNNTTSNWKAAIVANIIGGLIFFWVDRWIFS